MIIDDNIFYEIVNELYEIVYIEKNSRKKQTTKVFPTKS